MYFHEVPTGKTYQMKFESSPDDYGFSSGIDTNTDKSGWTECKSSKDGNLNWNAGLFFRNDTSYEDHSGNAYAANDNMEEVKASIGGHIYLDVNENGNMEPVERTAAVGGYTVNNAKMVVSLTNCMTYEVIETIEKRFPGTYSFGNLTEGSYKLRYEIQALTRVNTPNALSLYSIIDNNGNNSSMYETSCGKLGEGENIDSGDVGVRTLMTTSPYATDGLVDPMAYADLGASQKSAPDANASTLNLEGEDANSGGGNNSFVPALVGSIVTLSIVAVSAAIFVKRRHGDLTSVPFLGSGKADSLAVRSVGSNDMGAVSIVSGASNTRNTAVGSMIVEAGSGKGDDGIELGIRQLGTTQNSTIDELHEEESVGFEVYDDEDDGLQGSVDYGPVISDMIAKYSQKQGQNDAEADFDRDQNCLQQQDQSGVMTSPTRSKKHSPQRHSRGDNRDDYASADMYQTEARPHNLESQRQSHHANQYPGNFGASNVVQAIVPRNAQSYSNEIYDESQYQYNASGYSAQDNETVTSGSSRSTDPPAASYRDIPAPHVGWTRDIQLVGDIRHYETPHQYAAGNDGHVATFVSTPNDQSVHDSYIDYPQIDSGKSMSNSESAGQTSNSGRSEFASATHSLPVTGLASPFKRSYKSTRSSPKRSRRAQSNPRDGQLSERWKHNDATPAHSTVEYNAYSTADRSNMSSEVLVDDDKTSLSLGSDDPPGASYKNLTNVPPTVPPHRMTPPRKFSPNTSPIPRQDKSYPSPPPRSYPSPPLPQR